MKLLQIFSSFCECNIFELNLSIILFGRMQFQNIYENDILFQTAQSFAV